MVIRPPKLPLRGGLTDNDKESSKNYQKFEDMRTTRRGAIERRDLLYSFVVMRLSAVSGRLRNRDSSEFLHVMDKSVVHREGTVEIVESLALA